jgi:stress response protein SCP2
MGVNLQKGQKIDLTKGNQGLKNLMVGLGWDEAAAAAPPAGQKKGVFASIFGGGGQKVEIDCDASAILCGPGGKLIGGKNDLVYFGNLTHQSGSIRHMGDNLTGAGEGDDEQIFVRLDAVPGTYEKIVFVVNIYEADKRGQHFGMIANAFIRIVNADNNQELCKFNLTENYSGLTALIAGEIYRHNNEWKFSAIGQGTNDVGLGQLAQRFV